MYFSNTCDDYWIEGVHTTTSSVNGEFIHFICNCVLPIIMPFNGTHPRSVLVMDNASIYHLDRVCDIITGVGAKLCFLPPYSPDLMPVNPEQFIKLASRRKTISVKLAILTLEFIMVLGLQ
jgi:hypothetical protein